jgi:hypothetical protein
MFVCRLHFSPSGIDGHVTLTEAKAAAPRRRQTAKAGSHVMHAFSRHLLRGSTYDANVVVTVRKSDLRRLVSSKRKERPECEATVSSAGQLAPLQCEARRQDCRPKVFIQRHSTKDCRKTQHTTVGAMRYSCRDRSTCCCCLAAVVTLKI